MTAPAKSHVQVLIGDDVHRHIVVNSVRSQLQWSKSARANGWDREDETLAAMFLAWWNGKRMELWDMSWEQFAARDDVFVDADDAPEPDEVEDDEDPTRTATSDE